jgi:aminoglycoside phosphotransferase (APT) family kinase protein
MSRSLVIRPLAVRARGVNLRWVSGLSGSELADRLRAVCAGLFGGPVRIEDLHRMAGGASRETWSFTVHGPSEASRRLVLRRDPVGGAHSGLALEALLLPAAARAGVPVPAVVASGQELDALGARSMIVEFVEGETIPRRILRDDSLAGARAVMAEQCGTILAAVHRIPPAEIPGLPTGDPLDQLRALSDRLGQPHPAFELAFGWLEDHRPTPSTPTVVHGDFRNGNLIVGPGGVRAVLDWELAHVGDPIEDLGWLCVKAWRFGAALPVGGFGTRAQLVDAYERAAPRSVDATALRWWQVLGTLRWGIICIVQTLTHTSGALRSVELAAIGRRVCEVEWDLLELLG